VICYSIILITCHCGDASTSTTQSIVRVCVCVCGHLIIVKLVEHAGVKQQHATASQRVEASRHPLYSPLALSRPQLPPLHLLQRRISRSANCAVARRHGGPRLDSSWHRWLGAGVLTMQCATAYTVQSSINERRVPQPIPVLGSQPAGDVSHKHGGRLPLLSARPAVTPATRKRAAIPISLLGEQRHNGHEQFAQDCYPTASRLRFEPGPYCA